MSKDIIYLDLPKLAQPPISFMALPLLASASISRLASFLPIFSDKILWHRLGFKDKFSAGFFPPLPVLQMVVAWLAKAFEKD